jgi:hypothetical protein
MVNPRVDIFKSRRGHPTTSCREKWKKITYLDSTIVFISLFFL